MRDTDDGQYLQLSVKAGELAAPDNQLPAHLAVESPAEIAEAAQVEHALFAVVTRYFRDVFDRLVERPLAVFRIVAPEDRPSNHGTDLLIPISASGLEKDAHLVAWQDTDATQNIDGAFGRVRLLKVLLPSRVSDGGYLPDDSTFDLADLFAVDTNAGDPMNSPDGRGVVLGVSAPIAFPPPRPDG